MIRILLVDDEPDLMVVVNRLLTKHGFEVLKAVNGKMGLRMAGTEKPDIVLLDVMMNDLDGWEVSKKLKASGDTKDIPIIMFTIMVEDKYRRRSFEYADADWHVSKPFDTDVFITLLNLAAEKNVSLEKLIESAVEKDVKMNVLFEMINPKHLSKFRQA